MTTRERIDAQVDHELIQCISCHRCLDVCPIYDSSFSINELNHALHDDSSISSKIQKFVFSCFQCRQCVPVCPVGIHRDIFLLKLKNRLYFKRPWRYRRYLFIRGNHLSFVMRLIQKLFVALRRRRDPDLAQYMEASISSNNASILFYPGCYIYSPETIRLTLRLLNHVGKPYSMLAGVSFCCGLPHLLQGDFSKADACFRNLSSEIKRYNPKIIISGCAECLEALRLIASEYHMSYSIKSIAEYLMDHISRFPKIKVREAITLHDACRYSREEITSDSVRQIGNFFSIVHDMKKHKKEAACCAHWNFDVHKKNVNLRQQRLQEAAGTADTLVCDCLTCYEEFKKCSSNVEIIDVLQLFDEALDQARKN